MDIAYPKERRRFPRLNEYIFILCQFMEKEKMNIIKGFTANISAGGLMFETDRFISADCVFILEIYQPLGRSRREISAISTSAKVKWIMQIDNAEKYEGSNRYRIGVKFIDINDGDRKAITEYVQDNLRKL